MARGFVAMLISIIACSTIGVVALNSTWQNNSSAKRLVGEYVDLINSAGESYRHLIDDLCGMMEIAEKFREDPEYTYSPVDMERIIMRDGYNGTDELITVFNKLINKTLQDTGYLQTTEFLKSHIH